MNPVSIKHELIYEYDFFYLLLLLIVLGKEEGKDEYDADEDGDD